MWTHDKQAVKDAMKVQRDDEGCFLVNIVYTGLLIYLVVKLLEYLGIL